MKRTEEIMEILAAYDLTGSFRDAAALVGCDHHTVARYVRARDTPPTPSLWGWQTVSAVVCSPVPPSRLTAEPTWVTRPLRSTRITGFPRYYGTPRPCASLRYSSPCGFFRLEFSLSAPRLRRVLAHIEAPAESAGGISPPAAHRTGRTPLEVPGSWHPCSRARLRADFTSSSHSRWLAQLGCPGHPAPLAPLALPSFPATTRQSAPVLCVRYSTSRWSTT